LKSKKNEIVNRNTDRSAEHQDAGYTDLHYTYVKNIGIGRIQYLKRKNIYRLQVAPTELKKNYPAAWVVDISDSNVDSYAELPF